MSPRPLVSIIIPTYNRAKFLPTAIQSALQQSYPNIEVIVIDDGSTDNTKMALEPFKDKIRYFATEHKGTAHARNVGMKAATGKYIAFLDSDDTYLPNKIEIQVSFIEEHPEVGMVYTEFSGSYENRYVDEFHLRTYHRIYEFEGWTYDDIFEKKGMFNCKLINKSIQYYIGDVFKYTLMNTFVPTNTILFPKKILKKVGYQNEKYRFGQEYEFVVRICKYYKVAFLNIPTYIILHHSGNVSQVHSQRRYNSKENIYCKIEDEMVMLNSVLDWGYSDDEFYNNNRKMIDLRLSDIYNKIGIFYIQYGDKKKSKEYLTKSYLHSHLKSRTWKFNWFFYTPRIITIFIFRFSYFYQNWIFILSSKSQRKRLLMKWKTKFKMDKIFN